MSRCVLWRYSIHPSVALGLELFICAVFLLYLRNLIASFLPEESFVSLIFVHLRWTERIKASAVHVNNILLHVCEWISLANELCILLSVLQFKQDLQFILEHYVISLENFLMKNKLPLVVHCVISKSLWNMGAMCKYIEYWLFIVWRISSTSILVHERTLELFYV